MGVCRSSRTRVSSYTSPLRLHDFISWSRSTFRSAAYLRCTENLPARWSMIQNCENVGYILFTGQRKINYCWPLSSCGFQTHVWTRIWETNLTKLTRRNPASGQRKINYCWPLSSCGFQTHVWTRIWETNLTKLTRRNPASVKNESTLKILISVFSGLKRAWGSYVHRPIVQWTRLSQVCSRNRSDSQKSMLSRVHIA